MGTIRHFYLHFMSFASVFPPPCKQSLQIRPEMKQKPPIMIQCKSNSAAPFYCCSNAWTFCAAVIQKKANFQLEFQVRQWIEGIWSVGFYCWLHRLHVNGIQMNHVASAGFYHVPGWRRNPSVELNQLILPCFLLCCNIFNMSGIASLISTDTGNVKKWAYPWV